MIRVLKPTVAGSLVVLVLTCRATLAANGGVVDLLTVDQIIDRYTAARGGAEAWGKTQTMAWTGHVESGSGGTVKTPFLMLFKRPDATRFEVMAQGQHPVRIFAGGKGWKLQPAKNGVPQLKPYSEEEISYARDAGGLDGPLFNYRAKDVTVSLQGKDTVAGHEAYRLKLILPSGQIRTDWIDAQSFLELKYDREARTLTGQLITVSVYYSNYQTVQGLVLPFTIQTGGPAAKDMDKMVIEKIAINPVLEDALFQEPTPPGKRHNGVLIDTTRGPAR